MLQNFHSNELDKRSLSSSVIFPKFSERYFVKWKSYFIFIIKNNIVENAHFIALFIYILLQT